MKDWITGSELQKRWNTTPEAIFDASFEKGLVVFFKKSKGNLVKETDFDRLRKSKGFLLQNLDAYFFNPEDVEEFELNNQEWLSTYCPTMALPKSRTKSMTCNAILKEPVFQETMDAIKDILAYCETNRPGKTTEAYDLFCRKYKRLTKRIFESIWQTIPPQMKRKQGQKDNNL